MTPDLDTLRRLAAKDPRYAKHLPEEERAKYPAAVHPTPAVTLPCIHEGSPARGPAGDPKTYYQCDAGLGVVCRCSCGPKCPRYAADIASPIPAGVVIGHYGMPAVAELQVRALRAHNGDLPVIVHDDHSPGDDAPDLDRRMAALGVEVVRPAGGNVGHAGGDLSAFWHGIKWADGRGLKVLVKLSQRLIPDVPGWVATAAGLLADGTESCLTEACVEGAVRLPLRTEAVALDVRRWATPKVLYTLRPRRVFPKAAEHIVHEALRLVGGGYRSWPLLGGPHRQTRSVGVYWHCNTSAAEYRQLAERFGVELGEKFFVHGWPKKRTEDWG